ncbi:MAG: hypothetical protein AB7F65_11215 [Dehalococcoidia bacterium]
MPEQTYLNLIRRFGLVLLVAAVLGAGSGYFLSRFITPTYESSTTLLITQQVAPDAGPTDLGSSSEVTAVLAQLVKTRPVLERAERTGITGYSASEIADRVDVEAQAVFMRITGSASTPEDARAIANVISEAFISTVNEGVATGPVTVAVVEPAGLPSVPAAPRKTLNAAAGGMFGLIAASALALVYVRMDDVVKEPSQVRAATGLPTMGELPALGKAEGPAQLRAAHDSSSRFTEAVRSARANLSLVMGPRAEGGFDRAVVLIASVREADGSSVSAANLALAFGRAGFRTLLIDCDFRHPSIHDLFEIPGDAGLGAILARRLDQDVAVQSTSYTDVFVLPAGYTRPSSVDALGSSEMRDVISRFRQGYEVILLSAPPTLEVPDAATLGPIADLAVIVGWSGRTRGRELQLGIESLERSGGVPVGVILNGAGKEGAGPPPGGEERARQQLPSARLPVEVATPKNPSD